MFLEMSASGNSSSPVGHTVENGVKHVGILPAINDEFGGVIVEMKEPMDSGLFHTLLTASLSKWRLEEGFWYHHAEPDYLMLVNWIPQTVCTIPANATHRVGVGAIVLNDKRELLVVQENSGKLRGVWKIPTGVVDEGEDIFRAAIREVKEETGVDAEFLELLSFRQLHGVFFQKSDLFFICMMRPVSFDIVKQEQEIEAAQWMPLEEFAAHPYAQKHRLFKYIVELCHAKLDNKYTGFTPQPIASAFDGKMSYLYLNAMDLKHS